MLKKIVFNIPEICLLFITTTVVLILFAEVIFRYFVGSSLDWIEEISRILLIWLVFIGAAVALKRNEHIAVHFFVSFFPSWTRAYIEIFSNFLILFFSFFLFVEGVQFVIISMDTTFPALQTSIAWLYIGLPIGCFLMIIYGLKNLITSIRHHKPSF